MDACTVLLVWTWATFLWPLLPSIIYLQVFFPCTKQQKQQRNNRDKLFNWHGKCLKGQSWSCWQWEVYKRWTQQRSCEFPEEGRLIDLWGHAGGERVLLSQVRQHFLLGQAWIWNICSACLTSGNMTFSPVALCSGRQSLVCPDLKSCATVISLSDVLSPGSSRLKFKFEKFVVMTCKVNPHCL